MSEMAITYIGGPTAILEYAGLRLMTDPTFDSPQRYVEPGSTELVKTAGPGSPSAFPTSRSRCCSRARCGFPASRAS